MAASTPPGTWPVVMALITGCVVVGLAIGLMAGVLVGSPARYLAAGISVGAVLSIPLIYWRVYRPGRR